MHLYRVQHMIRYERNGKAIYELVRVEMDMSTRPLFRKFKTIRFKPKKTVYIFIERRKQNEYT